jgi:iron complex outermembrane receptor protein
LLFYYCYSFSILAQNCLWNCSWQASGQPIPGVNVYTGTVNGVSTDFDGKFQLSNVKKGIISFFLHWLQNSIVNYNKKNQ